MRRLVAVLALFAAGCTFEWNGAEPGFGLSGTPPPLSSFDKLNVMPSQKASLMLGPDGANWTAFCEFRSGSAVDGGVSLGGHTTCKRMHLVELGDGGGDETIEADAFTVAKHELFVMHDDASAMTRTVTMHRPGDSASADVSFVMPAGRALLYANDTGNDDVFVYLVEVKTTTSYDVFRRDQKFQLALPLPPGVDPTALDEQTGFDFLLTADGNTLVVHDPGGGLAAWSTLDGTVRGLGVRPDFFVIDELNRAVLTVGDDGFHSVALDGSFERVLSPDGFDPATLLLDGSDAFYQIDGTIYQVPLDGSATPAAVVEHAARLWLRGPGGELVYSKNPPLQYAAGAGDGWLGPWNFMERGHVVHFSGDGARLFFLEHAATAGGYGDLTAVAVPNGAPDTLAINVHRYDELVDGRLVAIENAVYGGSWNRLVLIDEAARLKTWLVPSAVDYVLTPDSRELVVDVVTGASGYDILRVPAP